MQEVLDVRRLKKTFRLSRTQQRIDRTSAREKIALDGLSFKAYAGEVYGLLGPNGAGKTTCLRIMSTLIKPDEGDVFVDGASAVKEEAKVRGKIGFLTSELKLEDFFTPNYLFDFFSELQGIPPEVRDARKKELFEKFGIDKFAEVKVANLSTGMKQKTSIVISIVHDPEVIVFDEPTNGLDVITAKTVTDFLLEQKAQGKCVIVSTHIFSLVEKICDRVGVIIDGKLYADGTLDEVRGGMSLEDRFFEMYTDAKRQRGEFA